MPEKRSEVDAVAEVYARSLFELADETGGLGQVETTFYELQEIVGLLGEDERLSEFMRSVVIPTPRKRESLQKMFGDGKVSDLVLRFLLVLNDKDRLGHLDGITTAYRDLYWEKIGRMDVVAYTPAPLDDEEMSRVADLIRRATGKDAEIENKVDPSMIGGLKLRIGDQLIDASIATRLTRIRESLTRSGAETARARFSAMIED